MVFMIGDLYQPRQIEVSIDEHQLAAIIEATHDALIKRVKWTVMRESHWAALDYEVVRMSVGALAEAYTTFVFTARDLPPEAFHGEFFSVFGVTSDMWNLINAIVYGKGWENVPIHPHMPGHPSRPACGLCDAFEMA
jgi:hypothetical protein